MCDITNVQSIFTVYKFLFQETLSTLAVRRLNYNIWPGKVEFFFTQYTQLHVQYIHTIDGVTMGEGGGGPFGFGNIYFNIYICALAN